MSFIDELADSIQKRVDQATELISFDPKQLDDEVALRCGWDQIGSGATNYDTHKARVVNERRVELRSTISSLMLPAIFILVGVISSVSVIANNSDTILLGVFIGAIFTIIGSSIHISVNKPRVFDKDSGNYWKGRKIAQPSKFEKDLLADLNDIYAVQLIPRTGISSERSYRTMIKSNYELNLVKRSGERVNVVSYVSGGIAKGDARTIADFLGVKLWDITI
jgi:hypothetical protein